MVRLLVHFLSMRNNRFISFKFTVAIFPAGLCPLFSTSEQVNKAIESVYSTDFDSVTLFIEAMLKCNKLSNGNSRRIALAVLKNEKMQKSLVKRKKSCEVIFQIDNKVIDKKIRVFVKDKGLKFPANQVNSDALAVFDFKSIAQYHKCTASLILLLFKVSVDFKEVNGSSFESDSEKSDIELGDKL